MKKTFPVNINGKIFYIDEDAYELLLNYLDQLRSAFSSSEGDEIVTDIESRISELFDERIAAGANAIVFADVNKVIEIMGKPSEITDSEDENADCNPANNTSPENNDNTTSTTNRKTLYRNPDNKVLGGVISGIATYLNLDANVIRICAVIALLTTLIWPPTIILATILYLIAWMVITPANTPRRVIEMNGNNGMPNNATQPNTESTTASAHKINKTLYRNINDKVFGGVISGLATYLGWETNVMRVLIALLAAFTYVWPMTIIYMIAWMIIPPANTPRRVLEMHGSPVTVDSIGQNVLSSTPPPYYGSCTQNNNIIGKAFSILGKCIIGFFGLIGSVGALVATGFFLFFLTALIAYTCFNSIELLQAFDYNILEYRSSLAPTLCCIAIMALSLCFIIPGIALAWSAAAILFNSKGAAKITIITAVVLEVIFIVATIILFIFTERLCNYYI